MAGEGSMGVYRFHSPAAAQSFIGFSRHMEATRKRMEFELRLNACSYKPLQLAFNSCGGMQYECLELYLPSPGETDLEIDAHLMALLLKHKAMLDAELIQLQI